MDYRHISTQTVGTRTLVTLSDDTIDEIDERGQPELPSHELLNEFRDLARRGGGEIVLDARRVTTLNHASMSVVFRIAKSASEAERELTICCQDAIKQVWDICRGNEVARATTDFGAALADRCSTASDPQL